MARHNTIGVAGNVAFRSAKAAYLPDTTSGVFFRSGPNMRNRQHLPCATILLITSVLGRVMVVADEPVMDGIFSEWDAGATAVKDPLGDATAVFDLSHVAVQTHGTRLYVHFDIGRELNLQAGPGDEGTLQLLVDLADGRRLSIDFRNRLACWTDRPDEPIAWTQIKYTCLPTFAAPEYELRVDLATLGARVGDTVKVQFAGSDSLAEPMSVALTDGPAPDQRTADALDRAGDVRIANLNTFYEGLSHAPRSERIKRLLAAVNADICCFQEELREELFRSGAPRVVPRKDGAPLHVHWQGDCGIATCWPLEPLPMEFAARASRSHGADRSTGVAAAVQMPDGRRLVVCAVHLSCCGHMGDGRDHARVREARQIAHEIERLRDGQFGQHLRDAAVIVVGDYNLVGSREPLAVLESAALTEYLMCGLVDRAACTWRGDADESYWPGRLDLLTYDAARLTPAKGFILNTDDLPESMLAACGLRRDDSTASDHLLLVADFVVSRP